MLAMAPGAHSRGRWTFRQLLAGSAVYLYLHLMTGKGSHVAAAYAHVLRNPEGLKKQRRAGNKDREENTLAGSKDGEEHLTGEAFVNLAGFADTTDTADINNLLDYVADYQDSPRSPGGRSTSHRNDEKGGKKQKPDGKNTYPTEKTFANLADLADTTDNTGINNLLDHGTDYDSEYQDSSRSPEEKATGHQNDTKGGKKRQDGKHTYLKKNDSAEVNPGQSPGKPQRAQNGGRSGNDIEDKDQGENFDIHADLTDAANLAGVTEDIQDANYEYDKTGGTKQEQDKKDNRIGEATSHDILTGDKPDRNDHGEVHPGQEDPGEPPKARTEGRAVTDIKDPNNEEDDLDIHIDLADTVNLVDIVNGIQHHNQTDKASQRGGAGDLRESTDDDDDLSVHYQKEDQEEGEVTSMAQRPRKPEAEERPNQSSGPPNRPAGTQSNTATRLGLPTWVVQALAEGQQMQGPTQPQAVQSVQDQTSATADTATSPSYAPYAQEVPQHQVPPRGNQVSSLPNRWTRTRPSGPGPQSGQGIERADLTTIPGTNIQGVFGVLVNQLPLQDYRYVIYLLYAARQSNKSNNNRRTRNHPKMKGEMIG